MATKKIKINFKMPTPTAAERLHALQQKNRKAAGLPDPSEYKKKLDSMKKENYEEDDGPLSQEQLDEISPQLKASYVSGAKKQIKQSLPFTKKTDEYRDIAKNFIAKRQKGIAKANEEVEQLDEMPESSMKTRDVHSHLKKSGWELARSKGGHDVYKHPKAKHSIPVPRHNQLKAPLIRGIMKASKVEEGVTLGRLVGRGNIYQYDRNPGPRDGSELEHVPFHAKTEKQKKLQNALNDLGKKMKETHPKLREAKDSQEYDYEGDMAKSDLRSIIHNAQTLHDMLDDDTNLAEWCQSKITLAEDYISTVTNYMRSEMKEEVELDEAKKMEYDQKKVNHLKYIVDILEKEKKEFSRLKDSKEVMDAINKAINIFAKEYTKHLNALSAGRGQDTNFRVVEEVELDEMIRVKTNKPIGTRIADIGPGGKEYNVKTDKAWDDSKKKQPQGADFAAQRRKERLAKSGRMDEKENLPGLWANIRAKKARGESPAKPGDKDYPKDLESVRSGGKESVKESTAEPTEGEMKGKQGYSRKAQIVMNAAKGKKSDSPEKYQKDPELSSEIHKT